MARRRVVADAVRPGPGGLVHGRTWNACGGSFDVHLLAVPIEFLLGRKKASRVALRSAGHPRGGDSDLGLGECWPTNMWRQEGLVKTCRTGPLWDVAPRICQLRRSIVRIDVGVQRLRFLKRGRFRIDRQKSP